MEFALHTVGCCAPAVGLARSFQGPSLRAASRSWSPLFMAPGTWASRAGCLPGLGGLLGAAP